MNDSGRPVILAARFGEGHGIGHAVRCIRLGDSLRRAGRRVLLVHRGGDTGSFLALVRERCGVSLPVLSFDRLAAGGEAPEELAGFSLQPPPAVLLDLRASTEEEIRILSKLGVPVGIDEGGAFRDGFPFLADLLPRLPGVSPANRLLSPVTRGPGPDAEAAPPWHGGNVPSVLVSFGGEDPAGLTERVVRLLVEGGYSPPEAVLAVKGPLGRDLSLPKGVTVLAGVPDLSPLLRRADLLFTSFGLTACEGAALGTAVILCSPSVYHEKLSRASGFPTLGTRGFRRPLGRLFPEGTIGFEALERIAKPRCGDGSGEDLASLILSFAPEREAVCPLCGAAWDPARFVTIHRGAGRSFARCSRCGAAVLFDPFPPEKRYGSDYFFSEYRAQYGRDYLEDFDHIRELSRPRVEIISSLLGGGEGKRLLDIGCAFGPFLSCASEAGFRCEGLEPSGEAVAYIRERFGFQVFHGTAEELPENGTPGEGDGLYDAVTLWYVVEHLPRLYRLLPRIAGMLKKGGVLAFSTPSFRGISARRNPGAFFEASPADHLCVLEPRQAARAVAAAGFRIARIRSTGIHPGRFPLPFRLLPGKLAAGIAEKRFLGDTFELYAEKV